MRPINFIFIVVSYLSLVFMAAVRDVSIENQAIIVATLVFGMGIPHGAIDHILHNGDDNKFSIRFLFNYVGAMSLVLFFWLVLPKVSLTIFLIISAYHFGEAQFSDAKPISNFWSRVLNLSWGAVVLLTLFIANNSELLILFNTFNDTQTLSKLFIFELLIGLLIISVLGLLISSFVLVSNESISKERLGQELYMLGFIIFTFYALPLLIAFTIFFCIMHSLKVLNQEYKYLNDHKFDPGLFSFIRKLAPFTLISAIGALAGIALIRYNIIPISILLFSLISISMITTPHSFVMTSFYRRLKNLS